MAARTPVIVQHEGRSFHRPTVDTCTAGIAYTQRAAVRRTLPAVCATPAPPDGACRLTKPPTMRA